MHIIISLSKQTLNLFFAKNKVYTYTVSTALLGSGNIKHSNCTPLGEHIIRAKIGVNTPINGVFSARRFTGEIYTPELAKQYPKRDWILTRILWLSGLDIGKNRLKNVDTMQRYIYIHGTPDTQPMGIPKSDGCIRMQNHNLIALFDKISVGINVKIVK